MNSAFEYPPEPVQSGSGGRPFGTGDIDWQKLVNRIESRDPTGMDELYRLFSRGIRFYLCRHLGPQDLEDKVHDTFIVVLEAVQTGELRDPDRLMAFVRTVVRRHVAGVISRAIQQRRERVEYNTEIGADRRYTPEEMAIRAQNSELAIQVLRSISNRDREILTRFYLLEETVEEICSRMHLTLNQFRLVKSRALRKFISMGKRHVHRRVLFSRAG